MEIIRTINENVEYIFCFCEIDFLHLIVARRFTFLELEYSSKKELAYAAISLFIWLGILANR